MPREKVRRRVPKVLIADLLAATRELDGMPCLPCGEAGRTLTCAPVSTRNWYLEEVSSILMVDAGHR